ncbi:unnamed protein product [Dibothriocephalus latus]|uniref:Uncharacterized protein n=1 Tax=Dibothriocephalus latus TaxID=60516 RepID=A0A3P7MF92_DIBLA|nr:unnamed protein product [Dibothriocephalus latus]
MSAETSAYRLIPPQIFINSLGHSASTPGIPSEVNVLQVLSYESTICTSVIQDQARSTSANWVSETLFVASEFRPTAHPPPRIFRLPSGADDVSPSPSLDCVQRTSLWTESKCPPNTLRALLGGERIQEMQDAGDHIDMSLQSNAIVEDVPLGKSAVPNKKHKRWRQRLTSFFRSLCCWRSTSAVD